MAIVVLYPIVLWGISILFKRMGWSVTNYLGNEVPYSLGLGLIVAVFIYSNFINSFLLFYLTIVWITGLIDDRFGSKYPKGIKGHIRLFLQTGKLTTGLIKLISTLFAASIISILLEGNLIERLAIFLLLILPPHIMNLFDTRPLRVWKIAFIHFLLIISSLSSFSFDLMVTTLIIIATLVYFEGTKIGMLGDNGATLLGGVISIIAIYQLPFFMQWCLICLYLLLIYVTEKISISEWIEKHPVLKKIDRFGVS